MNYVNEHMKFIHLTKLLFQPIVCPKRAVWFQSFPPQGQVAN